MQEIKCPNCGEVFAVDESGYAQIVQQVRDKEFDKELRQREKDFEKMKEKDLELAKRKQKDEFDKLLSSKEAELVDKDKVIQQLKAQVSGNFFFFPTHSFTDCKLFGSFISRYLRL